MEEKDEQNSDKLSYKYKNIIRAYAVTWATCAASKLTGERAIQHKWLNATKRTPS